MDSRYGPTTPNVISAAPAMLAATRRPTIAPLPYSSIEVPRPSV